MSIFQIVDLFHAKEHLSSVAKSIFGPTSNNAKVWATARHEEDSGELDKLLAVLSSHIVKHSEVANCHEYFARNRECINYQLFKSQGICTSTGVVEAGCRVAIGARLKRSGMHWSVPGADAVIALRCCKLSGCFEDFWERRASARIAA
jgi:hypothetical protein